MYFAFGVEILVTYLPRFANSYSPNTFEEFDHTLHFIALMSRAVNAGQI